MKYVCLILLGLVLLTSCSLVCQEKNESCCMLWRGCTSASYTCIEGSVPKYMGCDVMKCRPMYECVPAE